VDFSPGSEQALERALRLPVGPKTKVTLLHVLPDDIPGVLRKQAIRESEARLEKVLARAHDLAVADGLSPSQFVADVVEGDPAQQILKRAHTVEADLVCLGRHGRRPVADLFIGSVAQKVARAGDVPVLVVKHPADAPYARAVVALEPGRKDARVLRGAAVVLKPSAKVTAIAVAAVPFEGYLELSGAQVTSFREQAKRLAQKDLRATLAHSPLKVTPKVLLGDPRVLVLEEAVSQRADVLVVGFSNAKGLSRLLVGSVSQWVLTHAATDVLVTAG
jgi:nucleotide-binding universal stress UspA family protein